MNMTAPTVERKAPAQPTILYTLEAARVKAGYSVSETAQFLRIEKEMLEAYEADPNPGNMECTLGFLLCKLYKISLEEICWRPLEEYRGTGVRIVRMEY